MTIHFIDLKAQQKRLSQEINSRIQSVLTHGQYIMGPEVRELEQELADFSGAKHALGCANGTDAIMLALMAWGIGPGSAVFCPSFTYCATAEVVAVLGATPIFVDVDRDTYNMDVQSLKQAILETKENSTLTAKAIIAVDIFGQSANYPAITPIAKAEGLKLIADSAQGFGSTLNGHHPLHWADLATTSFFPAKPLGCYGDGGAVFTNNDDDAEVLDSLRIHGKGATKYENIRVGLNSRLDTLQAAILLPKLAIFSDEIVARNKVAKRYIEGLRNYALRLPTVLEGVISTWAQFTIEVENPHAFGSALKDKGIPTARYYPNPVHSLEAYKHFPHVSDGLPNTVAMKDHIISLPMHPYLDENTQDKIIEAAKSALTSAE